MEKKYNSIVDIIKKSFNLTTIKKFEFFLFFIISFLYSISELFGIGLIIIFLSFLLSSYSDNTPYLVEYFLSFFEVEKSESFVFLVFLIFIAFLLRFLISILLKFFETNFKRKVTIDLVSKTLRTYLQQSHEWYVSIGPNRLVVNITDNCNSIVDVVIVRLFSCLTSLIILLAFIISVFFVNPLLVGFVTCFMTLVSFIIYNVFSSKNKIIAEKQFFFWNTSYSFVKSSLECFSIIKVLKKKKYFQEKFSENFKNFQSQIFEYEMIREFTKIFFEFIFILIVCMTLLYGHIKQSPNLLNLEFLIFYSLIFLRSLPHFTLILEYLRNVRKIEPQLNSVVNVSYDESKIKDKVIIDSFKKIQLKNVVFKYNDNSKFNVKASLSINKGEKIAIVGMSGSGKTTLAHLILGLAKAKRGGVFIDGKNINDLDLNFMSYTPQNNFIVNDTLRKNISLDTVEESEELIMKIIKNTSLENVYERFNDKDRNYYGNEINLSSGESQRLSICRGLYAQAHLLVFDEPTSNLDSLNENKFLTILKKLNNNSTVVMITHKLRIIKQFDKICFMDKGKIVAVDNFDVLYKRNKKFKIMYDYQEFIND